MCVSLAPTLEKNYIINILYIIYYVLFSRNGMDYWNKLLPTPECPVYNLKQTNICQHNYMHCALVYLSRGDALKKTSYISLCNI